MHQQSSPVEVVATAVAVVVAALKVGAAGGSFSRAIHSGYSVTTVAMYDVAVLCNTDPLLLLCCTTETDGW